MLPASLDRAYQDFITLLTKFTQSVVKSEAEIDQSSLKQEFQELSVWFKKNIEQLNNQDLAPEIAPRWQAVQTEILREFKLLSTDILFLASSRQQSTQVKRLKSINGRLTKLVDYCQIMLKDHS